MPTSPHPSDTNRKRKEAGRAWTRAAQSASSVSMWLGRWAGNGDYAGYPAESRDEAGQEAIERIDRAMAELQAARDKIEAQMIAEQKRGFGPGEDLHPKLWQELIDDGFFTTPTVVAARLAVSDQAAELSDSLAHLVPLPAGREDRPEDLVETVCGIVCQAGELLERAVIAARAAHAPWRRIDEAFGSYEPYSEQPIRPAEARFAKAVRRWENGLDQPFHITRPGGLACRQLPDAVIEPGRAIPRLDAWCQVRLGTDEPDLVSRALTSRTADDRAARLASDMVNCSGRELGRGLVARWPVHERVLAERTVAALAAAVQARPKDSQAATSLAGAGERLAELRARSAPLASA